MTTAIAIAALIAAIVACIVAVRAARRSAEMQDEVARLRQAMTVIAQAQGPDVALTLAPIWQPG